MKKTITTLSLLLAFFVSFASGTTPETGHAKQKEAATAADAVKPVEPGGLNCTITQSAVLSVYGSKVEVTCTVTRPSCNQAAAEAIRCIRDYKNQIREALR